MALTIAQEVEFEGGVAQLQIWTATVKTRGEPMLVLGNAFQQTFDALTDKQIMEAGRHTIIIEKGSQFQMSIKWYDSDGVLMDLSDYSAIMMVRENKEDAQPILVIAGQGEIDLSSEGEIEISKSGVDTGALTTPLRGFYDLKLLPHKLSTLNETVDIDVSAGTITAVSGSPFSALVAGDWIELYATSENDGVYEISSVTSSVITLAGTTPLPGSDETNEECNIIPLSNATSIRLLEGVAVISEPAVKY